MNTLIKAMGIAAMIVSAIVLVVAVIYALACIHPVLALLSILFVAVTGLVYGGLTINA